MPPHRAHSALHDARAAAELLGPDYLAGLAAVALEDGVVTDEEHRDLDGVALLLGLPAAAVDEALATPRTGRERWQLRPGDLVVFTGATTPPREDRQRDAAAAGLAVGDSVTQENAPAGRRRPRLDVGRGPEGRQCQIPIVHPAAYQGMLAGLKATV
jgi:DNA polymerase-3 subunit epsilon